MEDKKLEAIKNAYGEYWEQVKDYVDEDGCVDYCDKSHIIFFKVSEIDNIGDGYLDNIFWRPKTLNGIERNNGWLSMKSKHDFEIEKGQYFTMYSNGYIEVSEYDGTAECYKFWKLNFTHYQPIIKPQPPIY